jgi:ABC-type sulfate transport system permease component
MLGPLVALLAAVPPHQALEAYRSGDGLAALRISLEASLCATALATGLGVPAGYWLTHCARHLRGPALFALALPLAFPPVASGIMLLHVLGTRSPLGAILLSHGIPIVDAFPGVVLAEFFVAGSFVAIAAWAAFSGLPALPEEAARTLGVSEWRIFTRVALPAAIGNVGAGIAFAWLRAIGEYGATSVLAYHPTSLPVEVYVRLSAAGVAPALGLCYGFAVLAAAVLGGQWVLRRRVV